MPLLTCYIIAQYFQFVLPSGSGLSLGSAVALTALCLLGTGPAVFLVLGMSLVVGLLTRSPLERLAFNLSDIVLSVAAAGWVYQALGGVVGDPFGPNFLALFGAIGALALSELVLTGIGISLYKGRPLWASLGDFLGVELLLTMAGEVFSIPLMAMVLAWGAVPALALTSVGAVAASVGSRWLVKLSQERFLSGLLASTAHGRSEESSKELLRVASVLSEAAGLDPTQTDALRWAALLHDIGFPEGTLGVEEGKEKLSAEETKALREHPVRAATRVGKVGNLLWVARTLETHHEQYDGWGYPFGLKGKEIPLTGALLGLAETYLALMRQKHHVGSRRAAEQAVAYIRARSGEKYSPEAVAALEKAHGSGALDTPPAVLDGDIVAEAIQRLRRATEHPQLPRHVEGSSAGADRWLRRGRLFARLRGRLSGRRSVPGPSRSPVAADWYQSLYELGKAFGASLEVEQIAVQLGDVVHRLTTLPCEVSLIEDDGVTLRTAAVMGLPFEALAAMRRTTRRGLTGVAFSEKRPVVAVDVSSDPRVDCLEVGGQLGIVSSIVVPLFASDTALGAATVYSPTEKDWSPMEVEALTALGASASLALHNAFLYRKASERLDQLDRTHRFLNTILDTVETGILTLTGEGGLSTANKGGMRCLEAIGLARSSKDGVATTAVRLDGTGLSVPLSSPGFIGILARRLGSRVVLKALATGRECGPEIVHLVYDEETGQVGPARAEENGAHGFDATGAPRGVGREGAAPHGLARDSAAPHGLVREGIPESAYNAGPGAAAGSGASDGAGAGSRAAATAKAGPGAVAQDSSRLVEGPAPGFDDMYLEVWAAPIQAADEPRQGLLVVLADVTAERHLEAEVRRTEKLAAMGEVAAKAAHEIRNPLTAIQGFLQLLDLYCPKRSEWPECLRFTSRALGEMKRLEEIVRSMLDMTRPARPVLLPGDLAGAAREVVDFFSGDAARQSTHLVGPSRASSATAAFDGRQMKQVLLNLIQNALDAVAGSDGPPAGGRKVLVSTGRVEREGRKLAYVEVRDNGPGISADNIPSVFTPFFTTKETGTGLGLAVSKGIVEAHGGTIEVRPARPSGAAFTVFLPALPERGEESGAREKRRTGARGAGTGDVPARPPGGDGGTGGQSRLGPGERPGGAGKPD